MNDKQPSQLDRISAWVNKHRALLTLAIALVGAIGAYSALFANTEVNILVPSSVSEETANEGSAERERLDSLYQVNRSRHSDTENFLFADYIWTESDVGIGSGRVEVFAANQETYSKVDFLSCSYPDGSKLQTDSEQGVLLISCSFADWYRDRSNSDDEKYSYAVTTAWFFNSDAKMSTSVSCECIGVTISAAELNVEDRILTLSIYTTGTEINVSGLRNNPILLEPVDEPRSSGPPRVLEIEFDERWNEKHVSLVDGR